jgi:Integrase core domain/Mu transposase, C-terminal
VKVFVENEIIRFFDANEKQFTERILWIDEGYKICFTIAIFEMKALPTKRLLSELEELLCEGRLEIINEVFPTVYRSEDQISEEQKRIRDDRWNIIKEVCLVEPGIYEKEKRGQLVKSWVEETKKSKRHLYKYLKQYWREGKLKNSLLPKYNNSGGKGKERKAGNKKRGRPRDYSAIRGKGINIDDEIKRIFEIGIKKYYLNSKKRSLKNAFEMILSDFFADEYRYEDGVKKPIINDEGITPTKEQFVYWFKQNYQIEEVKRKRLGDRKYELEHRPVLGTSVGEMYGPGTKYQIDATVADVYLVSSYNRNWIIGRPIIYVVIDVFSRMITGLYVGLEGPSWLGASMALANAASDKVDFCKQYGITINEDEWNTKYLPKTLIADNGELEGYNVERLISAFNMKVENTPPYRADWKGIVEQHFRIIHQRVKPFLPGVVDTEVKVRGERDYRLDAKLTLKEFTAIIIRCTLYHNNYHMLKNYDMDEMMIKEEVDLIPSKLWDWGLKNRSGSLRNCSDNVVKLHLLPIANATVTYKGIVFKGIKYTSDTALKEGWFAQAREKSWRIKVSYDLRDMNHIYLPTPDGQSYEILRIIDHEVKKFSGHSSYDVNYLRAHDEYSKQKHQHQELQKRMDLQADITHIVSTAVKETNEEKIPMSNRQKTIDIRKNRAFEKEVMRKEEAFLIESQDEPAFEIKREEEQLSINKPLNKIELLRQKQKEIRGRANGK